MAKQDGVYEVLIGSQMRDFWRWQDLSQKIPHADVHFLPQYAQIYERRGDGTAHCFVYRSANGLVLHPFLMRRVNDMSLFYDIDECWDITTSYGYGGPLYRLSGNGSLARLSQGFLKSFHTHCLEHRIVSEFARLHPLLDNQQLLPDENKVFHHETLYIDLQQSEEDLWKGIRKGHKSSIKKAVRFQVKVVRDEDREYVQEFHKLYIETMRRQEASPSYFLPLSFFEDTLKLLGQYASLFVGLHDARVVTAAIILHYGDYAHYHFSGSDVDSLHLCSNHLLLYKVAKWAQQQGAKFFHLGGGLQPNDNLFMFKSGFSNKRAPFYTYRRIHDPGLYQRLVQRKLEDEELSRGRGTVGEKFFPRYRA